MLGAIAFIVGSIMDTLDGRYSRMSGKGTLFGAFLDSTLDRIEEGVVLAAVCWHFAEQGDEVPAAACLLVVLGSLMVSYTRARAEALGVECKVGIATRPVRVVILSAGLLFADGELIDGVDLLPAAIYTMLALTAFTVVQRVWHVRGQLKELDARRERLDVTKARVWCSSPSGPPRACQARPGQTATRSRRRVTGALPTETDQEAFAFP